MASASNASDVSQTSRSHRKRVLLTALLIANFAFVGLVIVIKAVQEDPLILLNQVGYLPQEEKSFMVQVQKQYSDGRWTLLSPAGDALEQGNLVYQGRFWGKHYYGANLSITTPGEYILRIYIGWAFRTAPIHIGYNIYDKAFERGSNFFYYQRSGCVVHELVPGYVGHALDHMDDGYTVDGVRYEATGGWFSDGSYSKYILWGAHNDGGIYSQLWAYDLSPQKYTKDVYNLTGHLVPNGIPDVLDEAMWGIRFARKLTLSDGSVS